MRLLPKLSELGSFLPKRVKSGVREEAAETDNMSLTPPPHKMLVLGWWHFEEGLTFDPMGGPQVHAHSECHPRAEQVWLTTMQWS